MRTGFPLLDGDLDDRAEVLVAALAADVARVDAVLGQRARALGILREQQVPVVVEVADDRDVDADVGEARDDLGNGRCGLLVVHRDANELRAGGASAATCAAVAARVGGVGVRHRLHDDRMRRSHGDGADECGDGAPATWAAIRACLKAKVRARGNRTGSALAMERSGVDFARTGGLRRASTETGVHHGRTIMDQPRARYDDDGRAVRSAEPTTEAHALEAVEGPLDRDSARRSHRSALPRICGPRCTTRIRSGDRAGFIQKFSKKGWLCKTWEGEIAMANLPGTQPEMFDFSVRDDTIASAIHEVRWGAGWHHLPAASGGSDALFW